MDIFRCIERLEIARSGHFIKSSNEQQARYRITGLLPQENQHEQAKQAEEREEQYLPEIAQKESLKPPFS